MTELHTCRDCGTAVERRSVKGRWPTRCPECKRLEVTRVWKQQAETRPTGGRKPDTLCAGGCGCLLWSGSRTLPAGQMTCRSCRRDKRVADGVNAPCVGCGKMVKGSIGSAPPGERMCQECRSLRAASRPKRKRASRNNARSSYAWQQLRARIIDDSDGVCSWCNQPIDLSLSGMNQMGPTVDHGIELAVGGDLLNNVFTVMHRRCNNEKEIRRRRSARATNPSRQW